MKRILFICLGNICRSPAAQAILEKMAKDQGHNDLEVASCALGPWHVGALPDRRMRTAAQQRGYSLESRAQELIPKFYQTYDYLLAADKEVLQEVEHRASTAQERAKIFLMTAFARRFKGQEIPDPYHGTAQDFEHVLDMVEDSCAGLLEYLYPPSSTY